MIVSCFTQFFDPAATTEEEERTSVPGRLSKSERSHLKTKTFKKLKMKMCSRQHGLFGGDDARDTDTQ